MFRKKIKFITPYPDLVLHPVPIKKVVPQWYKDMKNYLSDKQNFQRPTVKKCVPVLDTFTSGYAILNPLDVVFWQDKDEDNEEVLRWEYPEALNEMNPTGSNINLHTMNVGISRHEPGQISKKFVRSNEYPIPLKILNPWIIKTPKNYSCLFTNPLNRENDGIRIIDGIVDTDDYDININFPFFIKKIKEGQSFILKKNQPVALVFPYQRDSWKMEIGKQSVDEIRGKRFKFNTLLTDKYKKMIWKGKKYD